MLLLCKQKKDAEGGNTKPLIVVRQKNYAEGNTKKETKLRGQKYEHKENLWWDKRTMPEGQYKKKLHMKRILGGQKYGLKEINNKYWTLKINN